MPVRIGTVVVLAGLAAGCGVGPEDGIAEPIGTSTAALTRGWTQADVDEITQELRGADPATYRLALPVFSRGAIIGQTVVGSLSMAQVGTIATRINVPLRQGANAIAAKMCCGGTMCGASGSGSGGSGGSGGGANQPTNPGDLSQRLAAVLRNIDGSQYQYLR